MMHPRHLQYAILTELLSSANRQELEGLTPARQRELVSLPLGTIEQLLAGTERHPVVEVRINAKNLDSALRKLRDRQAALDMQRAFILRGASSSMMFQLFHIARTEVIELRKSLGKSVSNGRPKLPTGKTQIAIFNAWSELSHLSNLRQRYLQLHDRFTDIPLSSLYAIISMEQ